MNQVQCLRFQNDQFKALQCIYLQQFHPIKETNPQKFTIACEPYSNSNKQNEYKIKIVFEFTQNYPKTPLKYQIQPIAGITRDSMAAITHTIEDILANNRDRPIVYDIVQQTRIWIQQYLVLGKINETEDQIYTKKKEEVFQKPKFATYTPVTLQSFTAWKREFDAKNKLKKAEKQVKSKETEIKVTGKQWFLGKKPEQIDEEEDQDQQQDGDEQELEQKVQKYMEEEDDVKSNKLFE